MKIRANESFGTKERTDSNNGYHHRFDSEMYAAYHSWKGSRQHERFGLRQSGIYLVECSTPEASLNGLATWEHINGLPVDAPHTKACNNCISEIRNVSLDSEYPPNPSIAHEVARKFLDRCIAAGLMTSIQPIEDSGAGIHFVTPIVPIQTTEENAEKWNRAVAAVVRRDFKPLWNLACTEVEGGDVLINDLLGYDISRVMSPVGSWRPTNPKKADCAELKGGVLRTWLSPYTDGNYPERVELASLTERIRTEYASLSQTSSKRKSEKFEGAIGDNEIWLVKYYERKKDTYPTKSDGTPDRSVVFNSLVWAAYKKFKNEDAVLAAAETINRLSGRKFEGRLPDEITRSLASVPEEEEESKPMSMAVESVSQAAGVWARRMHDTWAYDRSCEAFRVWNGTHWEQQQDMSRIDLEAEAILTSVDIKINSIGVVKTFIRFAANHLTREFSSTGLVNYTNGTLRIENGRPILYPHRKEDGLISCLPFSYTPNSSYPNISRFLTEDCPDECGRKAYMAHIGLSLLRDMTFHKSVCSLGPGRSGKSTALALVNASCGIPERETLSFAGKSLFDRDLEAKRTRFIWNSKPVVCIDELPAEALKEEEILKKMIAHGGVEMRGINLNEKSDNRWRPKIFTAANDTPYFKDNSEALKERLIFIRFPNHRSEKDQDKDLFERSLRPELGAFTAACINEALEVMRNNCYPMSAAMIKDLGDIATGGNPLKTMIKTYMMPDAGAKMATDAFYESYKRFCVKWGVQHAYQKNSMTRAISDMHIDGVRTGIHIRDDSGKVVNGIKGLRFKTDDEMSALLEEND